VKARALRMFAEHRRDFPLDLVSLRDQRIGNGDQGWPLLAGAMASAVGSLEAPVSR
jgi:hypothetical protein